MSAGSHTQVRAGAGPSHLAVFAVMAAGVCAALHVGKLPPAVPVLQRELSVSLVQAGFLLSIVQFAGMTLGVVLGAWAQSLGLKRAMVGGLLLQTLASILGGVMTSPAALLALRAVEGLGFFLVVLPGPALLQQLVRPEVFSRTMAWWSAYMPMGTAIALLVGPLWIAAWGWPAWWNLMAAATGASALAMAWWVPKGPIVSADEGARAPRRTFDFAPWWQRLRHTLVAPGPWVVAIIFACYSAQWLAVIGFLPTVVAAAGYGLAAAAVLTALVAAVNIVGNLGAGRLIARGMAPRNVLLVGFVCMLLAASGTFGGGSAGVAMGADESQRWPAWARYASMLVFSSAGGLVPSTLFYLATRVAPSDDTVSTTVGWMQQWSAFGQFVGPPMAAWMAAWAGGWHLTAAVTGACAVAGALVALSVPGLRQR